ncbi:SICA antigen [Plasmodium coatneyi]|uniref:SICA antigen n=1 Tax=Plasmodium coatneyi TaxID=208452 RepID=A0A1B1DTR0_9APIC|nr:SICA antigen [Plasmodium coatneyi]ANQ06171.1 SICA antigen [Plasmodium coatneyi]
MKERERKENEKGRKDERRKVEDCSMNTALCDRVKCVTTNWFNDRITKAYQKQTWCQFWNTDVKNRLESLSKAMTNTETGDYNLCKDTGQKTDGTSNKEANRKACEYIVKGLEHIYKIGKSGGWTRDDPDQRNKMERNQQFGQTMSCFLLNAYANKLKEDAKEPKPTSCDVEQGIKKAFEIAARKRETWCKDNGNCVECTRQENLTCTLDVKDNLWDADGSKGCMDDHNNIENKVKGLLGKDDRVKRTLKSICRDCTKKDKLCERLECIAHNWFEDRINNAEVKRDWCPFWNPDAISRLKELSEAVTTNSESMGDECKNFQGKDASDDDANKKACKLITAGLKGIYQLQEGETEKNKKKARNNRLTSQTMYCLFLNAYADKLKQQVKSPCNITEETIRKVFEIGNRKKEEWCVHKETNQKNDCVECKREPNLTCTLDVNDDLRRTDDSCYKNKDDIGPKVQEVFDKGTFDPKKKEIEKALDILTDINSLNKELCDRVKCIYHRWGENRKDNSGTYQDWEKFWKDDVKGLLERLSKDTLNESEKMDQHCTSLSGADKKACEIMVRGLEHIYKIERGTDQNNSPQKKDDNLIFHRTFSCMLLNIFADEMKEKCQAKKEEIEKGITHAFQQSEEIKKGISPCSTEGDLCPLCIREEGYTSCKISQGDRNPIEDRMKKMFTDKNAKTEVKEAMKEIDTICRPEPPQPAATKPATTKPVVLPSAGGAGRSATTPSNTGKSDSVQCGNGNEVVGGQKEALKCLGLDNDGSDNHTRSSQDEEEDQVAARNKHTSHVTVVDTGTTVIAGPALQDSEKKGSGTLPPGHKDAHTPSTGTDTQTPSGSSNSQGPGQGGEKTGSGSQVPTETKQAGEVDTSPGTNDGHPSTPNPPNINSKPEQTSGSQSGQDGAGVQTPSSETLTPKDPGTRITKDDQDGGKSTTLNEPVKEGSNKEQLPKAADNNPIAPPSSLGTERWITLLTSLPHTFLPFLCSLYFTLGKRRRRHRREEHLTSPPLDEQPLAHVDDQDGPYEYTLVKECKPRSTPIKRRKKRDVGRCRAGRRGVGRRMIIDIHLEVLDECQKGDLHSSKENFFEILVQEFMGSELMKEENVPKEEVPSSDFGFKVDVPREQVQS